MKNRYIILLFVIVIFYSFLYFWHKEEMKDKLYPVIHKTAVDPDDYLMEAKEYESMNQHSKSAQSIERAIHAIWRLEANLDDDSFNRLEQTIERLEIIHRKLVRDSVTSDELLTTFEYALGNLAHAELGVAEKYGETNQWKEAKTALRFALVHIKNALIVHHSEVRGDSLQLQLENSLSDEIKHLLAQKDLSDPKYSDSLKGLIRKVDQMVDLMGIKEIN